MLLTIFLVVNASDKRKPGEVLTKSSLHGHMQAITQSLIDSFCPGQKSMKFKEFSLFMNENKPLLNHFVWKFRKPCALPILDAQTSSYRIEEKVCVLEFIY